MAETDKPETSISDHAKALQRIVALLEEMSPKARSAAIAYICTTFGITHYSAKETP